MRKKKIGTKKITRKKKKANLDKVYVLGESMVQKRGVTMGKKCLEKTRCGEKEPDARGKERKGDNY